MIRKREDPKIDHNPFLILLLKAIFKWEVYYVYQELSKINYGRYYCLKKPIDRNYLPPDLTDQQAAQFVTRSASFRREFIDGYEMLHTKTKLDDFAQSVCLLGQYNSWDDFLLEHAGVLGVEFAAKANKEVPYEQINAPIKIQINRFVQREMQEKQSFFEYGYQHNDAGFQVAYHKYIGMVGADRIHSLHNFCEKMGALDTLASMMTSSEHGYTWFFADRAGDIRCVFSLVRTMYANDMLSARESINQFGGTDVSTHSCHIKSVLYDSEDSKIDLMMNLARILRIAYGVYSSNTLHVSVENSEYTSFLEHLGFKLSDDGTGGSRYNFLFKDLENRLAKIK